MSENPVLNRLIGHNKPPSLRVTIIGGVILLIISAVGAVLWMSATPGLLAETVRLLNLSHTTSLPSSPVPLLLPRIVSSLWVSRAVEVTYFLLMLIAFAVASYLTAAEVKSEAFPILQTTNIKPRTIAEGLIGAALFRMRVPLAIIIALTPLMFIHTYQVDFAVARYSCLVFVPANRDGTVDVPDVDNRCILPDDPRIPWTWVGRLSGATALIGWVVLAAALGTSLTLWQGSLWKTFAVGFAAVVISLAALALIGPGSDIVACEYINKIVCRRIAPWPPVTLVGGFLPAIPFALAWAAIHFARYPAPK